MIIKKLRAMYREKYYLSPLDLIDSAERNRFYLTITSPIFFFFGLLCFSSFCVLYHDSLSDHIESLIYFGIFIVLGSTLYIYSRKIKNVALEKSSIFKWKTFPLYVNIYAALGLALYNFYILGQNFNGFLIYCLTGFISLCMFSFSPFVFMIGMLIAIGIMTPGLSKSFGWSGLADAIMSAILMICLAFYKRRSEKKLIILLKKQKNSLEAKTFGNFTLIYENKVVKFNRTKSNELVGYLIYKNGSSVNTKELISVLYGDQADSARYGSSLRNLIIDIKHTLNELGIQSFFIAEYNNFRINPEIIKCDYYDFLAGEKKALANFAGEFMSQYSWAEETAAFLEQKALK